MTILYIATSIDGRIADENGGVGWLDGYGTPELNYDEFYDGIETLIMGRDTYDTCRSFGDWPYPGKHCIVLSSRPLGDDVPDDVEQRSGSVVEILNDLQTAHPGATWLVGGGNVNKQFLEANLINVIELYVIPVVIGKGPSLFGDSPLNNTFKLVESATYSDGMVKLRYESTSASS